jgi:hypothetical protein
LALPPPLLLLLLLLLPPLPLLPPLLLLLLLLLPPPLSSCFSVSFATTPAPLVLLVGRVAVGPIQRGSSSSTVCT